MTAPDAGCGRSPHVSVVIPARNCAEHLPACLAALDAQTYAGTVDITVGLAPSDDDTRRILSEARLGLRLQIVDNPSGNTPAGLNAAIGASQGTVIARVDAQSRVPPNYIDQAVATMAATRAANVGGVQRPVAGTDGAATVAAAMRSPFGAGPAVFRHGSRAGPVDTVYLGVFDREAVESVGGFDETLERNQDYELNWRLRSAGFVVWLDPELVVDYVPRTGYAALARQYFAYGAWKRRILLRHPKSLRLRQLAAPTLVAGLAVSAVQLVRGRPVGAIVPSAYACACATAAARLEAEPNGEAVARAARERSEQERETTGDATRRFANRRILLGRRLPSVPDRLAAMGAFAVMHLAWGAGFLCGRTQR